MSLRPLSTSERNDLEMPVSFATCTSEYPRCRRSAFNASPSCGALATFRGAFPFARRSAGERVSEEIDVDVGAACKDGDSTAAEAWLVDDGGQCCGAGGFDGDVQDSPVEGDGRKDVVVRDDHDIVDGLPDQLEGEPAATPNGEAVGERVDRRPVGDFTRFERGLDPGCAFGLYADDLDFGLQFV